MGNTLIHCCSMQPPTQAQIQLLKPVKIIKKRQKKIGLMKGSVSASVQSPQPTEQDQVQEGRIRENCKSQNVKKFGTFSPQQKPKKLSLEDFQIEGLLGKGGFGAVYLAQLKSNIQQNITQKYAIKCVFKQLLQRKHAFQQAIDQKMIAMSGCQFIVSLVMSFQDDYRLYYVMQYAAGGDTFGLINGNADKVVDFISLGQQAIKFIGGCVILGLEFIHNQNYIYRDLKPENIMLFENGYVKLTDFGLAKKEKSGEYCKTITGTVLYEAPQMVLKRGYDRKYDLWCLGVYLYEMSNCCPPFQIDEIIIDKFQDVCLEAEKNRIWVKPDLSEELKDLIDGLLKFDPQQRLGAEDFKEIKYHPFFQGFDWEALKTSKMPSPLKELVRKYPIQICNESLLKNKQTKPLKNERTRKIQGWTYYGKYSEKI